MHALQGGMGRHPRRAAERTPTRGMAVASLRARVAPELRVAVET
jgi:hypothetical protein